MKVYCINYGHYENHKQAHDVLKKKFPGATIFACGDKFAIRILATASKPRFEEIKERITDKEAWTSELDY